MKRDCTKATLPHSFRPATGLIARGDLDALGGHLAGDIEDDAAFGDIDVLALDIEGRERGLRALVGRQQLYAGLVGPRRREQQRHRRAEDEDVGDRRVGCRRVLAVKRHAGRDVPGVADASGDRIERLREGIAVGAFRMPSSSKRVRDSSMFSKRMPPISAKVEVSLSRSSNDSETVSRWV